jgi:molybdopterin converting factor small subunit
VARERRRHGAPAGPSRVLLLSGPLAVASVIVGAWGGSTLMAHPFASVTNETSIAGGGSAVPPAGRSSAAMAVRVRLTSWLQVQLGRTSIDVVLPQGADVGALLERLNADYPVIAAMGSSAMIAVSGRMASQDTVLVEGELVELTPAMAGG